MSFILNNLMIFPLLSLIIALTIINIARYNNMEMDYWDKNNWWYFTLYSIVSPIGLTLIVLYGIYISKDFLTKERHIKSFGGKKK